MYGLLGWPHTSNTATTMKKQLLALSLVGVFGLPLISSAATYNYVDLSGTVQSFEAATAADALIMVSAAGNTIHSGVALDRPLLEDGEEVGNTYLYVAMDGTIKAVQAATVDAAFVLAVDREPSSGMLLTA